MKKVTLSVLLIVVNVFAVAQGTWTYLNPEPTLKDLLDVYFVSETRGWVVGKKSLIMHTNDGGENWEIQNSDVDGNINAVQFVDENEGWAVSWNYIYHTTDGGEVWDKQFAPYWLCDLTDVFFLNHDLGWIVGTYGLIMKTENGGETWSKVSGGNSSDPKYLRRVYFVDELHGWAVGSPSLFSGGLVLRTVDGGETWTETSPHNIDVLESVYFADSLKGWICGRNGEFYHSDDGGITWTKIPFGNRSFDDIYFFNQNNGILIHGNEAILSFDGGQTWDSTIYISSSYSSRRFGAYGENFGAVVGAYGSMAKTLDGGSSWDSMKDGMTATISDIGFFDESSGYALQGTYSADLYATSDGGENWIHDTTVPFAPFYNLKVYGQTCFLLSTSGKLLKSHNSGTDWDVVDVPVSNIETDMHFVDQSHGFLCADSGVFYKTENGGLTWSNRFLPTDGLLHQLFFVTEEFGCLIDRPNKLIWRTEDGCNTWTSTLLTADIIYSPQGLYFINETEGFCTTYEGMLFKTTDGGQSWQYTHDFGIGDRSKIIFTGENEAWYKVWSHLYHSTDGGATWTGPHLMDSHIHAIFFLDGSKGWVGGFHGLVATYDYIVDVPENEFISDEISVLPNPASNKLLIATPKGETIESIRLYDVSGKLIMQNTNLKNKAEYSIDVSEFKTGAYILQIGCEGKMTTKKFIKK